MGHYKAIKICKIVGIRVWQPKLEPQLGFLSQSSPKEVINSFKFLFYRFSNDALVSAPHRGTKNKVRDPILAWEKSKNGGPTHS